jgi:antitoxin component YwqK of YwqJK toxin-antitoxin module
MKHLLAPILLLTFLFPSLAFGETMNDLVKRDGLYYKKFSTVPFTGKTTGQRQRTFKDGKNLAEWNGVYVRYHGNGQLESKGTFKDSKKDGPWVFYTDNGTKRFIKEKVFDLVIDEGSGTYKDGKKVK